jgi:hypothetical protein
MPRPTRAQAATVLLAAATLLIPAGGALAQQGGGTGPKVTEQNVDEDGFIRVHEQGIADVNVTNQPAVTVANQPTVSLDAASTQLLTGIRDALAAPAAAPPPAPATRFESVVFSTGFLGVEAKALSAPMHVSAITVQSEDEGFLVVRTGGDGVLQIDLDEGPVALPQPVPADDVLFACLNEASRCEVRVSLVGS